VTMSGNNHPEPIPIDMAQPRSSLRRMLRDQMPSLFASSVPLLARHGIDLTAIDGDGRRFSRVYRETWKRTPLGARRQLLGHWRSGGGLMFGVLLSPIVLLTNQLSARGAFAETSKFGHELKFSGKQVDAMPEDVVQDLIAHELAHVLQNAIGIRCVKQYRDGRADFVDSRGEYWGGNLELEENADCEMSIWGFDPYSIDQWSLATGRSKLLGSEHTGRVLSRVLRHGR
jgi:hypothetical protein